MTLILLSLLLFTLIGFGFRATSSSNVLIVLTASSLVAAMWLAI